MSEKGNFFVGGEDFEELRRSASYYVDKTELIYDLVYNTNNKVTLFTRPRRFGKTLAMSMLESFFDMSRDSRDVFQNLSIMRHEEVCARWMNQYPVLAVSFKDVNGLDFAVLLKHYNPQVRIVFTTGYSQYAADAYALHADGYIVKPVTKQKLLSEMKHLKGTVVQPEEPAAGKAGSTGPVRNKPSFRIQAFGNFEVFINEIPAHFRYNLTKEMFAYLIDRRGALCTNGELISILWEDASYNRTSYLKNLKSDLKEVLETAGCGDILVRQKGSIGVLPQKISCDYYDFMLGKESAVKSFRGEYMAQYSWGENTLSFLNRMAGKNAGH